MMAGAAAAALDYNAALGMKGSYSRPQKGACDCGDFVGQFCDANPSL